MLFAPETALAPSIGRGVQQLSPKLASADHGITGISAATGLLSTVGWGEPSRDPSRDPSRAEQTAGIQKFVVTKKTINDMS